MQTKTMSQTGWLILSALFAAMTAVCAQVILPIGAVPVSLSLLPVFLCGLILPPRYAVLSMTAYLLLGLCGVPVFSGFEGGPGKLFGVTGGYLMGYLPCVWLASWVVRRHGKQWKSMTLGMTAGLLACYALGTVWFMVTKHTGLWASLSICVLPFLPFDAGKIVLALAIRKALRDP